MTQAIAHPETRRESLLRTCNDDRFTAYEVAESRMLSRWTGGRNRTKFSVDFALFFLQNQSINNIAN